MLAAGVPASRGPLAGPLAKPRDAGFVLCTNKQGGALPSDDARPGSFSPGLAS